ncbi:MAG: hypothetical protein ACE5HS_03775 [bacterium]
MKKLLKLFAVMGILTSFALPSRSEAGARIYVRIGPPAKKTVRVVKPIKTLKNAVWVKGHWKYQKGRYVWVDGHFVKARPKYTYVQPYWVKTPRGYYFVPGHWVKR